MIKEEEKDERKNHINDQDDENEIISDSLCMLKLLLIFASLLWPALLPQSFYAQGK